MRHQKGARMANGFTFTEVLIVVVVIVLLSAIFIPSYLKQRDKARDAVVKQGVQSIAMGLRVYNLDHQGQYPLDITSPNGKYPLVDPSGTPYLDTWPSNPWTGKLMKNTSGYSKGDFQYAGFSSVAAAQPTSMEIDSCSLLGWVSSKSQPYVASQPGPYAVRVNVHHTLKS